MDKYEYRVKAEQIVKLVGRRNYIEAMKIADEIDWNRVKNVQMLCNVSDIYAKNERYEESREILYLALERSPEDRMIIYNIVELSLLLGDIKEAVEYFREYSQLAPNDTNIYILKYKLYAANSNTTIETLISILEDFKEQEFHEDWGFELARLYAEGGYVEQCIDLCDELDLWFNEGPFVIQALELKQQFTELTPAQQAKLEQSYAMMDEAEHMQQMFAEEEQARLQEEQARMQEEEQFRLQEEQARMQEEEQFRLQEEQARMQEEQLRLQEEQARMQEEEQFRLQEEQARIQEEQFRLQEEQARMQEEEQFRLQEEQARAQEDELRTQRRPVCMQEEQSLPENEEDIFFAGKVSKPSVLAAGTKVSDEPDAWTIPDRSIVIREGEANEQLEIIDNIAAIDRNDNVEDDADGEAKEKHTNHKAEKKSHAGGFFSTIGRLGKKLVEPASDYDMEDEDDEDDEINEDIPVETEEEDSLNDMTHHAIQEPQEKKFVNSGRFNLDDIAAAQEVYEEVNEINKTPAKDKPNEEISKISPEKKRTLRDTKPFDKVSFKEKKNRQSYEADMEDALKNIDRVVNGKMGISEMKEEVPVNEATPVWNGVSRYDTMNLQKELAKSIQKLLEATEKDDVDSTLEDVKRLVEDSNIPELTETMRFRTVRSSMLNNWAKNQSDKLNAKPEIEDCVRTGKENYVKEDIEPTYTAPREPAPRKPEVEVLTSIKLKPTKEDRKREMEQILTLENDGQIGLIMPQEEIVEKQITGQLNIQDVLLEFERQKNSEITEKEKKELENARNKALNETQEFMSQVMDLLSQCLPKCGDDSSQSAELLNRLSKVQKELNSTSDLSQISVLNSELANILDKICPAQSIAKTDGAKSKMKKQPVAESVSIENEETETKEAESEEAQAEEPESEAAYAEAESEEAQTEEPEIQETQAETAEDLESEEATAGSGEDLEAEQAEPEDIYAGSAKGLESEEVATGSGEELEDEQAEPEDIYAESAGEEEFEAAYEEAEGKEAQAEKPEIDEVLTESEEREIKESLGRDEEISDRDSDSITNDDISRMLEEALFDLGQDVQNSTNSTHEEDDTPNVKPPKKHASVKNIVEETMKQSAASLSGLAASMSNNNLDKRQKEALSYFANISDVANQVDKLLNVDKKGTENLIITGPDGTGKTSLAVRLIKAQYGEENSDVTVAKIKGASLNSQDLDEVFTQVNGGVLIIVKAAALSDTTMKKLCEKLDSGQKIQIILVTKKKSVERLIGRNPEFMSRFKVSIDLPNYNNDELVEYAKIYAKANNYNIEDMAVLALFSRLGSMQTDHGTPNFNDVKDIIDEAILHAKRRNKKIIKRLFGKKNEDSSLYLLEEDFE